MKLQEYRKKPPEIVNINGAEYTLNTDFSDCIMTIEALCDEELLDYEKIDIVMHNMYSEPYPENISEAVESAVNYLTQGREQSEKDRKRPIVLDFEHDEQYIYDAFMRMNIDLYKTKMTWWEFNARLRELPDGCMLCRIVHWRMTPYNKLTKEEKKAIEEIGRDKVFLPKKITATDFFEAY